MKHLYLLYLGCVTFLLLEIGLYLLSRSEYIPLRKPNYRLTQQPFLADSNPVFGTWHAANATARHQKSCFDVTYRTNSYGARDIERVRDSDERRVVVLGDSFIEGYGLTLTDRTTNFLELNTGMPHLNFGTSGHFGPTQYYLVYKSLASSFSHDAVLIGVLPDNDFLDDDIAYGRTVHSSRYRPYWIGEYPNYELAYYQESLAPANRNVASVKHILSEFTHAYNALTFAKQIVLDARARNHQSRDTEPRGVGESEAPAQDTDAPYSGYYDYSDEQLLRLQHNLRLIGTLARERDVMFFTIPRLTDIQRYAAEGGAPLTKALLSFAASEDMQYVDLLAPMHDATSDWDSYFHSCDDHWNTKGARAASEHLLRRLPFYLQALPDRTAGKRVP